jgi:hypothetical protein
MCVYVFLENYLIFFNIVCSNEGLHFFLYVIYLLFLVTVQIPFSRVMQGCTFLQDYF